MGLQMKTLTQTKQLIKCQSTSSKWMRCLIIRFRYTLKDVRSENILNSLAMNENYCGWCAQELGSSAKVLMFYCTSKAKPYVWTQATEVSENKSENSITHSSTVNDPFHLHCQFKGKIVLVHMFFLWSCGKDIDMVWHFFSVKLTLHSVCGQLEEAFQLSTPRQVF